LRRSSNLGIDRRDLTAARTSKSTINASNPEFVTEQQHRHARRAEATTMVPVILVEIMMMMACFTVIVKVDAWAD